MATRRGADELLILALARGATHTEAATAAGVSERTVQRRLTEPAFQGLVRAARGRLLEQAMAQATGGLATAVETLVEIMGNPQSPPAARVSAAAKLIDSTLRLREQFDTELRLANLEHLVASRVAE